MPDLSRLREELTIEVSDAARVRHLTAIRAGLSVRPAVAPLAAPVAANSRVGRRIAAAGTALALVALPTAAMAQNALPGEALHGLKLALENIQVLVDDDIRAVHRLQELDAILADADATDDEVEQALARATTATDDSSASQTAKDKIAELRERAADRAERGKPGVGPANDTDERDDKGQEQAPQDKGPKENGADKDPKDKGSDQDKGRPADSGPDGTNNADDDTTHDVEDREKPKDDAPKPEKSKPTDDAPKPEKSKPTDTGKPDDKNPSEQGS